MDYLLALDLVARLKDHCPVDTGALRASIHKAQGNPREWIITIGDYNAEISGTPTIQYAATTNFARELRNGNKNRNYHWANKAVAEWVNANKLNFKITTKGEY